MNEKEQLFFLKNLENKAENKINISFVSCSVIDLVFITILIYWKIPKILMIINIIFLIIPMLILFVAIFPRNIKKLKNIFKNKDKNNELIDQINISIDTNVNKFNLIKWFIIFQIIYVLFSLMCLLI